MKLTRLGALAAAAMFVFAACSGTPGAARPTRGRSRSGRPCLARARARPRRTRSSTRSRWRSRRTAATVGGYTIVYKDVDDSTAAAGKWDEATEIKNANDAVANDKLMAYIGTFNSGAAKLSIPILCAKGIVMISPANTYPGLTKAGKGEPNEPDVYYPNGCTRNYPRVVPADDLQGRAGAHVGRQARRQERLRPRRHRAVRQGHRRRLRQRGAGRWSDRPRPRRHRRQGDRLQGPRREDQGHQPGSRLLRRDHPEQRRPAVARPARRHAGRHADGPRRHLRAAN